MKKFFLTILFLFFVVVGGLGFFIIRSFNTDTFQKQIIKNITEVTGREFNVMGATYVKWFPTPQIVMNDISLANLKDEKRAVMLRANRIGVELEWGSLLKEPFVIKKIDVETPTLFLERIDATHVNWNFPFLFKPQTGVDLLGTEEEISQIGVESVSIRNGSIEYTNNVNQTKLNIGEINGNLSVETLQGPYAFKGAFQMKEETILLETRVQALSNDTPVPFLANLSGKNNNFTLDLTGTLTPSIQNSLQLVADGSFYVEKPNKVLKSFGFNLLDEQLDIPSDGNLTYETSKGMDKLKNFTIRFGNQKDSVAIMGSWEQEKSEVPSYNATIAINQLNYEQWANVIAQLDWKNILEKQNAYINLKLQAPEFFYHKIKAKDLSFEFDKKGDKIIVQKGKASLTGNTDIVFDGTSVNADKSRGFSISYVLKSEDFQELLKQVDNQMLSDNIWAKNVSASGNVGIYSDAYQFDFKELVLDKTKISGKLNYRNTDTLPYIQTKLRVENVNLDPYLFHSTGEEVSQPVDAFQLPLLTKKMLNHLDFIKKANASFDFSFKNAVLKNIPIGDLLLSGNIQDNMLEIQNLEAKEFANGKITASGKMENIGSEQSEIIDAKIKFLTPQLNLFMDKANLKTTYDILKKIKEISVDVELSEKENNWKTVLNAQSENLVLKLDGIISTKREVPVYENMKVALEYPDYKKFSKNIYDIIGTNADLNGALNAQITLNGKPSDIFFSAGHIQVGSNQLSFSGSYKEDETNRLVLNVEAPSFDVNRYIWPAFKDIKFSGMEAQKILNFDVLNELDYTVHIKTPQLLYGGYELKNALFDWHISGIDKLIEIKKLSGLYGSSKAPFSASGTINWQAVPVVKMKIGLKEMTLTKSLPMPENMSFLEGKCSFDAQLETTGKTPLSFISNLNGKGRFDFIDNIWVGIDLDNISPLIRKTLLNRVPRNLFDKEMNRLLNSGKTTIQKIAGAFTVENGVLKALNTQLNGKNFTSNPMAIQWDIPREDYFISIPLTLTEYADFPPFGLNIKGSKKALSYQSNYLDLSETVAGLVQQDNSRIAKIEQAKKDKEIAVARNEREEKIKTAISEAKEALKQASDKINPGDNQKALYLLQSAQDAMEFVNKMSIKETLTDAEYIQLTEQSRLVVMKAEKAVAEATNDKFFEDRKKMHALVKSASDMLMEIKRIHQMYPDIEIVEKLLPITENYVQLMQKLASEAKLNETDEEHFSHMNTVRVSYVKVVKAYQYVLRFDVENKEPIVPLSLSVPQNKAPEIFKRSGHYDSKQNEEENYLSDVGVHKTEEVLNMPEIISAKVSEKKDEVEEIINVAEGRKVNEQENASGWTESSETVTNERIRKKIKRSVSSENDNLSSQNILKNKEGSFDGRTSFLLPETANYTSIDLNGDRMKGFIQRAQ